MSKKLIAARSIIFLLIVAFMLKIFSFFSIAMGYDANPLYNHSGYSIFQEPDNSIDVLAIGDSNVYSGIFPLIWWEQQGFTGYAWGQASQRIPETYEYLKQIYKHQKPSIVLIDGNNLFRDKTDINNLDSITKAKLATVFPVISFHKNLNPHKVKNIFGNRYSVMKGYYYRNAAHKVHKKKHRMKFSRKVWEINSLSASVFAKCISYCKRQGSIPVLVSVPNYNGWNYKKHNALQEIADKNNIDFIDLNLELKHQINWKKDTADSGDHLNIKGAQKTTSFLGKYLKDEYGLPDRRGDLKYKQWDDDIIEYHKLLKLNIKKGLSKTVPNSITGIAGD